MRPSLYWDAFEERIKETVASINLGKPVPIRRVSTFITNKCNLKCQYCNVSQGKNEMTEKQFSTIVQEFPEAIIHITGGEPSTVGWLYPYLKEHGNESLFHLNTNLVREAPYNSIKRLKVSLDSHNSSYWNNLVGRTVFERIVRNLKEATENTITSITCTITRENLLTLPEFSAFCAQEFPKLYAVFFSVYKGTNPKFALQLGDAELFLSSLRPQIERNLSKESIALLAETIQDKRHLLKGIRFPENREGPCYLSMSERVYDWNGTYSCSHLYRDGIRSPITKKDKQCTYGCNLRLIAFNREVAKKITTNL